MIIAPCTANTMAKMANGLCDNILLATYMSADCPVFFAPAMDLDMYAHPSTDRNINILRSYGNIEIPAEEGELASGLVGKGRMAEPETILSIIETHQKKKSRLKGKKILVNAGPTHEKLDPVRFIGNYSSGKMGIAIAHELKDRGADVHLVIGPVNDVEIHPAISLSHVTSAQDMHAACLNIFKDSDAAILAAAVADYRPKFKSEQKIKKAGQELTLELEKTEDILASLGAMKSTQVLVGFALETNDEYENALTKLKKKNLDFIVLNSMNDPGAGFQKDTNKVTLIEKNGKSHNFETKPKNQVAEDICDLLEKYL